MSSPGKRDIDTAIVLALAAGGSVAGAARHAGCSEKTIRRRLADEKFREQVRRMRGELLERAIGRLSALGVKSADKLNELMDCDRKQVQLGAARAVLEYLFRGTELLEVEERLQAVEAALRARGENP
jgi:hypothetical protein